MGPSLAFSTRICSIVLEPVASQCVFHLIEDNARSRQSTVILYAQKHLDVHDAVCGTGVKVIIYGSIDLKEVPVLPKIDGIISVSYTHLTLPTKRIV